MFHENVPPSHHFMPLFASLKNVISVMVVGSFSKLFRGVVAFKSREGRRGKEGGRARVGAETNGMNDAILQGTRLCVRSQ